jgi:hypothetical protein
MTPSQLIAFKVTAWFEVGEDTFGGVTGNFDGQGLSFGPRQLCFGQGSLQPRLAEANKFGCLDRAFGDKASLVRAILGIPATKDQVSAVAKQMLDARGNVLPEWRACWKKLGADPVMQQIIMRDSESAMGQAMDLASWICGGEAKRTQRALCLAYDIVTQNGSIHPVLKLSLTTIKPIIWSLGKDGRDWLRVIAWVRSAWSYIRGNRAFATDVLARKLLIIEGKGKIHGEYIDLDAKFGVSDTII